MFELKPRHQDDPASHVYEEIPEIKATQTSNDNIYLDVVVLDDSTKKIVRFNNSNIQNQPNKTETLSSFKCILKKKSNLHSPQSNHSMSSSSSSYYTNSSISSSSSSIHSAAFNALIDTFLTRFQTSTKKNLSKKRPNKGTSLNTLFNNDSASSTSSSMSSLTNQTGVSTCCRCGVFSGLNDKNNGSNQSRLSFRVTDLTLEDLKIRQRMICKMNMGGGLVLGPGSAVHV